MNKCVLILALLVMSSPAFAARGGCGREIVFNCDDHTLYFNGTKSPIDCGAATRPKAGLMGQPGKGAGTVFKSMKGAPLVTLIPTPTESGEGNVVVHVVPPKNGRCPIGHNRSAGCIHVCPDKLAELGRCSGTPYRVIFSKHGSVRPLQGASGRRYSGTNARGRDIPTWSEWWRTLFSGQFRNRNAPGHASPASTDR